MSTFFVFLIFASPGGIRLGALWVLAFELGMHVLTGLHSLEQSVRDDLAILKANPLIRKELAERAHGFVYDIKTGALTPVKV